MHQFGLYKLRRWLWSNKWSMSNLLKRSIRRHSWLPNLYSFSGTYIMHKMFGRILFDSIRSMSNMFIKIPNAALCTSNVALQCQNDYSATLSSRYYLMSGQCIANTNRCKVMSSVYGTCSSCYFESGAYYTLVNGVCNQCSQVGCATYSTSC